MIRGPYNLTLKLGERQWYEVKFKSTSPVLKLIEWSNDKDFLIVLAKPSGDGNFTASRGGENSFAVSTSGLGTGGTLAINGTENLSNIIRFLDGGYVEEVKVEDDHETHAGCVIKVRARGPQGYSSGHLYLTDRTGKKESLSFFDNTLEDYKFYSKIENLMIVKVEWNNA